MKPTNSLSAGLAKRFNSIVLQLAGSKESSTRIPLFASDLQSIA